MGKEEKTTGDIKNPETVQSSKGGSPEPTECRTSEVSQQEIGALIKKMPPEEAIKLLVQMTRIEGPSRAILFDKFKDEHITQFLTQLETHDQREHDQIKDSSRKSFFLSITGFVVAIIVLIFLTFTVAPTNPTLYERLINIIISFVAGFFGGFGIGRSKAK